MIKATAFQMETVKVACHALRNPSGSRRFLVADEAGLGKTVVAQRIIEEFSGRIRRGSKRGSRVMNVIYVCSNLAIARQNQDRLLGFLTKAGRRAAIVEEDRLSLTLLPQRSKTDLQVSVRLHAVTPKTSLLDSSGRRGAGGTTKERALCHILTRRALGFEIKGLRKALALRVSVARFRTEVRAIEADGYDLPSETVEEFKKALRRSLSLSAKQRLAPRIKQLLDGGAAELVRHMRLALANVAISRINPDLVIFDEFQRFDDLIAPESDTTTAEEDGHDEEAGFREEARRLLQSLRGSGRNRALLLLSATPWIPYRSRAELNPKSRNSNDGFGEVVKFLYGSAGRSAVEKITASLLQRRELLTATPLNWREIDGNHDEVVDDADAGHGQDREAPRINRHDGLVRGRDSESRTTGR
jgi:hypothetical protein